MVLLVVPVPESFLASQREMDRWLDARLIDRQIDRQIEIDHNQITIDLTFSSPSISWGLLICVSHVTRACGHVLSPEMAVKPKILSITLFRQTLQSGQNQ